MDSEGDADKYQDPENKMKKDWMAVSKDMCSSYFS